jgi:hypothetical protein
LVKKKLSWLTTFHHHSIKGGACDRVHEDVDSAPERLGNALPALARTEVAKVIAIAPSKAAKA